MGQIKTFLGCFKLRTGCLFVGYMGAITGFLGLIFSIGGLTVTALRNDFLKGHEQYVNALIMWTCAGLLVVCSIISVLSVVLVVGVHEEKPKLLKVYLISMTIYLSIMFVAVLTVTVIDAFFGLRFLISFAWNIYYMLAIRSYYFEIKDRQNGTQKI